MPGTNLGRGSRERGRRMKEGQRIIRRKARENRKYVILHPSQKGFLIPFFSRDADRKYL
jgi:hypothetical protein